MRKEKHIFRLIYSRKVFPKAEYKILHKRTLKVHPGEIYSSVPDDLSYIPVTSSRQKKYEQAQSIVILDSFPEDHRSEKTSLLFINPSETPVPAYLFNILQTNEQFHFYLNYKANRNKIGDPERDDFYLFTAEANKPFMFYINGYFDRGESGHKTRTYVEHACYIRYYGKFEVPYGTIRSGINKVVPDIKNATVIDQRKLFY